MRKGWNMLAALALMLSLSACNGIFDDIYDEAVDDGAAVDGFLGGEGDDGSRFTLTLDARSYLHWYYIDLHNRTVDTVEVADALTGEWDGRSKMTYYSVHGSNYTEKESRPVDTQAEPDEWDIAIHHFDVKTNGGAAWESPYTSIDQLPEGVGTYGSVEFTPDEWCDNQCIVDLSTMMSYNVWYTGSMVNKVLTRWVTMDFSTPPPVYSASGKVYVLRMKDGCYAAIRLVSYMSDRGTKGYLTVEVKFLGA